MNGYSRIRAWMRSAFGVFIFVMFMFIFGNLFLGLLALAFFFFIPGRFRGFDANRIIFFVLMIIILFLAFWNNSSLGIGLELGGSLLTPWDWNTSTAIFIVVWGLSFIGGFFSNLASRQALGVIIILVSFFIFAAGVGGQEVGSAFFGEWWPSVHNFFSGVFEPLGEAFEQIGNTFGSAWMMLTNPVGYATQMLNSTYTTNPTGQTGAYGVEITGFDVTDMFVTQPYIITTILQNKGSHGAKDIKLTLCSSLKDADLMENGLNIQTVNGEGVKYDNREDYNPQDYDDNTGIVITNGCLKQNMGASLTQQEMKQAIFSSSGISCKTVIKKELRQRYIPLIAKVAYEYEAHSTLQMEFITPTAWQAQAATITSKQVNSETTTSPAKLSIGTINQPIIAGQTPFYIGLKLQSAEGDDSKVVDADVWLEYPADFDIIACTGNNKSSVETEDGNMRVTWKRDVNPIATGTLLLYCSFNALDNEKLTGPTKTYVVTAGTTYEFSRWHTKNVQLQFGGIKCCRPDSTKVEESCGEGMVCEPDTWTCGAGADQQQTTNSQTAPGGPQYCTNLLDSYSTRCQSHQGGCQSDNECILDTDAPFNDDNKGHCKPIEDGIDACCGEGEDIGTCKNYFVTWLGDMLNEDKPIYEEAYNTFIKTSSQMS